MHHRFWEPVRAKLRPQALVLVNAGVFDAEIDRAEHRVFDVPAREIAAEVGSPLAASMVLVGFYAGVTALVGVDALVESMRQSLPAIGNSTRRRTRRRCAPVSRRRRAAQRRPGAGRAMTRAFSHGTVEIASERCKGCELCIPACPPRVLRMSAGRNELGVAYPELLPGCTGCGACLLVCPDFCFEVYRYETPVAHEVLA